MAKQSGMSAIRILAGLRRTLEREKDHAFMTTLSQEPYIADAARRHCKCVEEATREALGQLKAHLRLWMEFERRSNLVKTHFARSTQRKAHNRFVSELRRLQSIADLAPARDALARFDSESDFPNRRPADDPSELGSLCCAVESVVELVRQGIDATGLDALLGAAETLYRELPLLCQETSDQFTTELRMLKSIAQEGYPRNCDLSYFFPMLANAVKSLEQFATKPVKRPQGSRHAKSRRATLNVARYLGDGRYQVGDDAPLKLQESENHVLASLIDLGGSASKPELVLQTGKDDAPRVLRSIKEKYRRLAKFIFLPGGKGKGGYRTTIRVDR